MRKDEMLEKSWEQREEEVYRKLFGTDANGIYTLSRELFSNQFKRNEVDPRWLMYGVIKFSPTKDRKTWLYVSSGLSNPWNPDDKHKYSGFGVEFVLETMDENVWAINLLQSIVAFNILLSVNHFGDKEMLDYGDRIPQPIAPNISHLIIWKPLNYPNTFSLCSGDVDLLQLVGVTKGEYEYAIEHGTEELCKQLILSEIYPVTDAKRESIFSPK